jgi:hypothetical protein
MGADIAVNRISCKPQKLQAMLATVKIGRGSWRTPKSFRVLAA